MKFLVIVTLLLINCKVFAGKNIVISVGVDTLQYGKSDFQKLDKLLYPISDAKKFSEPWTDIGYSEIVLENPTSGQVREVFQKIKSEFRSQDDIVIVYFSSHGVRDYSSTGISKYLLMTDSRQKNLLETSISLDEISEFLSFLPAKRKAAIIAACKSGEVDLKSHKGEGYSPIFSEFMIASATNDSGFAREANKIGDVYTHFLVKEILSGAEDLSLLNAHFIAAKATYEYTNGNQSPSVSSKINGLPQIFVNNNRSGTAHSTVRLGPNDSDKKVLLSGINIKGGQDFKINGGGIKRLEIFDANNELIVSKQIDIQNGKDYLLSSLISGPPDNNLSLVSNTYFFSSSEFPMPDSFYGLGLVYTRNYVDIKLSSGLLYYQANGKVSFDGEGYSARWQAIQIPVEASSPYLLKSLSYSSLFLSPKVKLSAYYMGVKKDQEYFTDNGSGLMFSGEVGAGIILDNNLYKIEFGSLYGIHSNFRSVKYSGISLTISGGISW